MGSRGLLWDRLWEVKKLCVRIMGVTLVVTSPRGDILKRASEIAIVYGSTPLQPSFQGVMINLHIIGYLVIYLFTPGQVIFPPRSIIQPASLCVNLTGSATDPS